MESVTSAAVFAEHLEKNKHGFVDFYADWCGPCKMIAPIIHNLAANNKQIVFLKVNVEEAPELCSKYSISAMPTFLAFTNGQKSAEIVGADKNKIDSVIASMK